MGEGGTLYLSDQGLNLTNKFDVILNQDKTTEKKASQKIGVYD